MPNFTARMQYLKAVYARYHKASKQEKGRILDEFCKVCRYHRKHVLRLLHRPPPQDPAPRIRRRRPFRYSPYLLQVVRAIWTASGYLCGQRLKEAIPLWLPSVRRRFRLTPAMEQQIQAISPRQLDARLKEHKRSLHRRFYTTTRPGRLLKSMIAIRTFNADIDQPGFLEIDTVAHCGQSLQGEFLYTLTATDIFTGWTDRMAVFGKGSLPTLEALKTIQNRLPFRLRGIDSDNGEEFINYHLLRYCQSAHLAFTRSRPNKKNDNPHVEQKNFTHVRAFLGWLRWDSDQALDALNALYAKDLLHFQNLFQPSLKLKTKTHLGSKIRRAYEIPKTPLDRLLASGVYDRPRVQELQTFRHQLDPFELSQAIDRQIEALCRLSVPTPRPLPYPPRKTAPDEIRFYFPEASRCEALMLKAQNESLSARTLIQKGGRLR